MKKNKCLVILFFCYVFLIGLFSNFGKIEICKKSFYFSKTALALKENEFENNMTYTFLHNSKKYTFKSNDFNLNLTEIQKEYFHKKDYIEKLQKIGLSENESACYIFPEIELMYEKLNSIFGRVEEDDKVFVVRNKCRLEFESGISGKYIEKEKFYQDILNEIKQGKTTIETRLEIKEYKNKNKRENLKEKGCFSTSFGTSGQARKNNIALALSKFDGLILNEGEVLSFNEITGERTGENGYSKAKIISRGTFVEGYGGGVCQVSTTLYNACLLAGLEVIEVNSHSLPVSYIEPSFDAMVNSGSSDLKIRNNTNGKIIITTSSENDICKVKIYGIKNKYKITRHSEKLQIIPAKEDVVISDYKQFIDYELNPGEEKRLSYSKDGFKSRGFLYYYDENGTLVKSEMIRENTYGATTGLILKREN